MKTAFYFSLLAIISLAIAEGYRLFTRKEGKDEAVEPAFTKTTK
jgi:hypothetical protein